MCEIEAKKLNSNTQKNLKLENHLIHLEKKHDLATSWWVFCCCPFFLHGFSSFCLLITTLYSTKDYHTLGSISIMYLLWLFLLSKNLSFLIIFNLKTYIMYLFLNTFFCVLWDCCKNFFPTFLFYCRTSVWLWVGLNTHLNMLFK